jgi:hypothetical protein
LTVSVVAALCAVAAALIAVAVRLGRPRIARRPRERRILVPFTAGALDPTVLAAAIRIARAEDAVLVPAYLMVVPLEYTESSPLAQEVGVAMPLLEAIEHAALRAGVPVDARIEKGRSATHALRRLWDVERFDRVIAPAPVENHNGFTSKDLTWILTHAPTETLVLRPAPEPPLNGADRQDARASLPTS